MHTGTVTLRNPITHLFCISRGTAAYDKRPALDTAGHELSGGSALKVCTCF